MNKFMQMINSNINIILGLQFIQNLAEELNYSAGC